jgi:hypothetical protein
VEVPPAPTAAAPAHSSSVRTIDPLTDPIDAVAPTEEPVPAQRPADVLTPGSLDPLATPPASPDPAPVAPARGWPCLSCGETVSFDEDECTGCGLPFLAGADLPDALTAKVTRSRSDQWKVGVMVGGATVTVLLVLLVMTILGVVF